MEGLYGDGSVKVVGWSGETRMGLESCAIMIMRKMLMNIPTQIRIRFVFTKLFLAIKKNQAYLLRHVASSAWN